MKSSTTEYLNNKCKFFVLFLLCLFGCSSEINLNGYKVYIEKKSIDGSLSAVILQNIGNEDYYLGIRSENGTLVIVNNTFIPKGYHSPIIDLEWSLDNNQVMITIDYDFGDGILHYIYDIKLYSLMKKGTEI